MDVGRNFLEIFKVKTETGNEFEVIVEYSWNPKKKFVVNVLK